MQQPMRILVFFLTLLGFALAFWLLRTPSTQKNAAVPEHVDIAVSVPNQGADGEFSAAAACAECHPQQHATWDRSFHRSMTQLASPEAIVAPFDGQTLHDRGSDYRFFRRGDRFFVSLPDLDEHAAAERLGRVFEPSTAPRVERQIVMTTGSHHYQAYWINSRSYNQLWRVPYVFHIKEKRWIPTEDAFLTPPTEHTRLSRWNDSCIQCHAVRGRPDTDLRTERYDTSVVDFGIACEACHGPGQQHIDLHRLKPSEQSDADTIVNPMRLDHRRSSQICGQCHSTFSYSDRVGFFMTGFAYRPGDDIHETRYMHDFSDDYVQDRPHLLDGYWSDGTMRLAGREFTAMRDAGCYLNDNISCTSCHSMHTYEDTADQLSPEMTSSKACLQCHSEYEDTDRMAEHTHHDPAAAGSNCLNCHMPYTSFGLLKSIRSHRIDSPSLKALDRPNACNLCHLDKSLDWTNDVLHEWYDISPVDHSVFSGNSDISAAAVYLLSGDPVQRAVTADAFARADAQAVSGDKWQIPLLIHLLDDPYSAVRFVAGRTIREYQGFQDVEYDFLAPSVTRRAAAGAIMDKWSTQQMSFDGLDLRSLLLKPDGAADTEEAIRLYQQRSDRPMELPE
jgi:hypothetical protein